MSADLFEMVKELCEDEKNTVAWVIEVIGFIMTVIQVWNHSWCSLLWR